MEKYTEKTYWLFLIIFTFLLFIISFSFHINIENREQKNGFITISEYQVENIPDPATPQGIRQRYTLKPDLCESSFCYLVFYSVHQEVTISIDNTVVYSMNADELNLFGHTPGTVWNIFQLNETDQGKEFQIDFTPIYPSSIDIFPTLYYGDRYDIIRTLLIRDFPALLLSIISVVAGIFYIGFTLYASKKGHSDNNLIMLGMFAIMIGLWKMSDMLMFSFLSGNHIISAYLPFFTLLLACVPYNIFIRNLHSTSNHWAWNIPCITCYLCMLLEILLQILHIADFRETLLLTHISIFVMILVIVIMLIHEIRTYGWSKNITRNVFCIMGCIVGLIIDTIIYYATKAQGTLLCGILGFVIYIFVLGYSSMQEIRKLIAIGQKAKQYQKMAYHDEMTGLFNRTAYAEYIEKEDFSPDHMIVAMFDLNNLKKCNDEFGHEQGDIYITTCAKLISDSFADIGNCYRIGGDEFCVLMNDIDWEICKNRVSAFYNKIEHANKKRPISMDMKVACGYVMYDKQLDYNIQSTIRRADKMMYKEKYSMKQQNKNPL